MFELNWVYNSSLYHYKSYLYSIKFKLFFIIFVNKNIYKTEYAKIINLYKYYKSLILKYFQAVYINNKS